MRGCDFPLDNCSRRKTGMGKGRYFEVVSGSNGTRVERGGLEFVDAAVKERVWKF